MVTVMVGAHTTPKQLRRTSLISLVTLKNQMDVKNKMFCVQQHQLIKIIFIFSHAHNASWMTTKSSCTVVNGSSFNMVQVRAKSNFIQ